jgi:pimeloyl-ACP methyl ester carboxylesterase
MKCAVVALLAVFTACSDNEETKDTALTQENIDTGSHSLASYAAMADSESLVVFESGLGDSHSVWTGLPAKLTPPTDAVMYDRAGYRGSTIDDSPRDIGHLRLDLEAVVDHYAATRKVVLVGHSLGGMVIRDYAIKNPTRVDALVFVDSSHEDFNQWTQEQGDAFADAFAANGTSDSGEAREAKELVEDAQYMGTLPNLPDVPVVVIDSMQVDADHDSAERKRWYDAKETLRAGVSNFTHLTTTKSGHYIMLDEPDLVARAINDVASN